MPTVVNSWRHEWHATGSGPTEVTIGAGSNRLLVAHVAYNDGVSDTTDITTPSLSYGGHVMSRQGVYPFGQNSFNQGGVAIFTLSESQIASAGSGGFGLSWSNYEPDLHGSFIEAFSEAGAISHKGANTNIEQYLTQITTSHTIVTGATVRASVAVRTSSWDVSWNVDELNEAQYHSGIDLIFGLAKKDLSGSGVQQITATTSGDFNNLAITSLLIEDNQTAGGGSTITRRQYAYAETSGDPVYTTLGTTPNSGNLLVAFSGHRVNSSEPTISGTGWTKEVDRATGSGDDTIRRQIAVFTKVAGGAEPSSISVSWGGAVVPTALVVQEFEGADLWSLTDSDNTDTEPATNPTSGSVGSVGVTAVPHVLIGGALWRGNESNLTSVTVNSLSSALLYQPSDIGASISISTAFDNINESGTFSPYYTWVETETDGEMSGWILAYQIADTAGDVQNEALAGASFDNELSGILPIVVPATARDTYDGVFYRPGVESTQFYTEVYTTSGWLDISDDVLAVNIYRRIGDLFRGVRPGECIVTLNNWDGKYTPDDTNHTYDIRPTFGLKVISTYLANTQVLFTGEVEALSLNADLGQRDLTIQGKDKTKALLDKTITTSLFSDIQVNTFVLDILEDIGITQSSVDTISNTIPVAWFSGRNALNALEEIAESGYYSLFVDGDGVFNFRNRNFELSTGNKISADEFFGLEYRKDDSRIFNKITVGGERRRITTDVNTLTYIVEPVFVSDGSTKDFFLSYFDFQTREPVPATGLVSPPTASEDVLINETSSGTGADLTNQCSWWLDEFSEASKCYIYNGSGQNAYITKFQIRGKPARKEPSIERVREVSSSQAVYGVKDFTIDNRWIQDESYAGDYADFLKQRFSDPQAKLTVQIRNQNPEARGLELGNLITVTNSYLGFVSKGFVIKELEHDLTVDRGVLHDVTLRVERPTVDENTIIFTLSHPVKGVLNGSGQLMF